MKDFWRMEICGLNMKKTLINDTAYIQKFQQLGPYDKYTRTYVRLGGAPIFL